MNEEEKCEIVRITWNEFCKQNFERIRNELIKNDIVPTTFLMMKKLAKEYNVSKPTILSIIHRKRKSLQHNV